MTVTPFDTFNRAAGPLVTSSSGHTWVAQQTGPYAADESAQAQVTSDVDLNGLGTAASADSTHLHLYTMDHGTGDSPAEGWEMGFQGLPTPGTGLGIVFRHQDATHYWHAFWYHITGVGNDNLVFLERQNGSTFASASPRVNAVANNTEVENVLKVVAIGSSIDVYFNEVLKLSVTDSSFSSATHHGVSFYFSGPTNGIDWFGRPSNLWTVGRGRIGERSGLWH